MTPRLLIRAWIVVALLAAAAAGALAAIERDQAEDQVIDAPATTTVPTAGDRSLPPGQVRVTGTVTELHAGGAVVRPRTLATPIRIDATAGFGNGAEITDAQVSGSRATIVWDAGRPLSITSGPGLVLDPLTVGLSPSGYLLAVGGTVCGFEPGSYHLATPVAVGTAGVAQPRDSVDYTADDTTAIAFSGTPAIVVDGTPPLEVSGPGRVVIGGDLRIVTREGSRSVRHVELAQGPYELRLARRGSAFTIEARLQGDVAVRET